MSDIKEQISFKELVYKFQQVILYIRSQWVVILAVALIGAITGFLYSVFNKPVYKGTLTFVLSNDSKNNGLANLAGQIGLDVGGLSSGNGAFEGENIIELLKSKRIIKGALFKQIPEKKDYLINVLCEEEGFFKNWKKKPGLERIIPFNGNSITPVQDSLIGSVYDFIRKKYLNIEKPDKKLSFYQVTTSAPNELIAVYLTRNLVEQAAKMYIDTKTKTARDNLKMLQFEADSLRNKLGVNLYSAASRVDQTFNLNPALQKQRVSIQENQVQMQVLGAAYGEVIKNLEIAKITLQKDTPLYQIIDEPQLPLVKIKIGKLKSLVIGGILAGIVCVIILLVRRLFNTLIQLN